MAYNLESLVQILNQFLQPRPHQPWSLDPNKKPQIEFLLEKACSLKQLFENSSPMASESVRSLESRIRDAAYDAEDILESHLTDRLLSRAEGDRVLISPPDLLGVIEELDLVKEDMTRIISAGTQMRGSTSSLPVQDLNPKNIIVGISDDLQQLKDRLTGQSTKLEIIPIVGMGGIGKTTLARTLYDDEFLAFHFDIRAWATISQIYNAQQVITSLLKCVPTCSLNGWAEDGLDHLYKILYGRRYLIVLDDVWSSKIWDNIKMSFPDENNGSRIIVTTRELSAINYLGLSESSHHKVNFLSEVESWNLLRHKVFAEETCPSNLEKIGRNIAKDCGGLPLAIHVVGGLLLYLERIEESWIFVAKDVSSAIMDKNEHFSNILFLSYNHLPNHLKPCFLYMAVFPENCEIRASELIRLWVAEGFLKPILGKNLEEAAKEYLKELVDRNLLLVCRQEIKRNVKSYIIHDLLRDLCIRKAHEEKFLYVMSSSMWESYSKEMQQMHRWSASASNHFDFINRSPHLAKITRSILFTALPRIPYHVDDRSQHSDTQRTTSSRIPYETDDRSQLIDTSGMKLLRILDLSKMEDLEFPEHVSKLVNLRYLVSAWPHTKSLSSMATLCNLQTLIINWTFRDPVSFFPIPGLKHIKFKGSYPRCDLLSEERIAIQEDLETLSSVTIDDSFSKILKTFPNLKKLGLSKHRSIPISSTIDMTCVSILETLKCRGSYNQSFLSFLIFPPSLKKLTLKYCFISLGHMESIDALPNLQILKLQMCWFENYMWMPREGGFCQLRLLVIEGLDLKKWMANETHYPRLEHLVIRGCYLLEEIPNEIGEILTLEIIEVYGESNRNALKSAKKIQNEQANLGNNTLHVRINAYDNSLAMQRQLIDIPLMDTMSSTVLTMTESTTLLQQGDVKRFTQMGQLSFVAFAAAAATVAGNTVRVMIEIRRKSLWKMGMLQLLRRNFDFGNN